MGLLVEVFGARSDNYGYLVHDGASGRTAAIDAPEEGAIERALERRGWTLTDILITHHHTDHVEAIAPLKSRYGATVTGPKAEMDKIGQLDRTVEAGDRVAVGQTEFQVLFAPGHTLGHIVYYAPSAGVVFTGDALFSMGVGRMFEGTPGPMWAGVLGLRDLPDETLVYCGHEYTQSNAKFALSIDPDNAALRRRAQEVDTLRAEGKFTIPVSLGMEKATNPFMRADRPEIARAMDLPPGDPVAVFAALRRAKDNF